MLYVNILGVTRVVAGRCSDSTSMLASMYLAGRAGRGKGGELVHIYSCIVTAVQLRSQCELHGESCMSAPGGVRCGIGGMGGATVCQVGSGVSGVSGVSGLSGVCIW